MHPANICPGTVQGYGAGTGKGCRISTMKRAPSHPYVASIWDVTLTRCASCAADDLALMLRTAIELNC